MKPSLHLPLATADDLRRLEAKLVRSRARFSRLLKGWLIFTVVLFLIGLVAGTDSETPPVFALLILGTGIWVAIRAARVFVAHPRVLAAQRELLRQRDPGAGRSDAALGDGIRAVGERLRGRLATLSPPRPELLEALDAAVAAAKLRLDELHRLEAGLARAEIRAPGSADAERLAAAGAELRTVLETHRLALAELETETFLSPGHLERQGLETLRRAAALFEPGQAVERTVDREAQHLYLKGRFFWNKRTVKDVEESLGYFEQAIGRDPRHALAWAGIADSWNVLGYYSAVAPGEAFPRARKAAEKALAIAPGLAEGHCSLAFTKLFHDWDWPGAEEEFRRTFELDPDYATGHHWYAEYLSFRGRHEEAIAEARIAVELDPVSRILRTILAWALYYARRYGEAIAELEEALELDPSFAPAEFWLALAYERRGRVEKARELLEAGAESGDTLHRAALGRLYAALGEAEKASRVLAELEAAARERYVPASCVAAIHCAGGNKEAAFEWLERGVEERDNWLVFLGIDPIWDDLRSEARFVGLLGEVGLGD